MLPFALSITFTFLIWITIVALNERFNFLSSDHFPSQGAKYFAYGWLGLLMIGLTIMVTGSALAPATAKQLAKTPFYAVFLLHAILVIFLVGWWLATGRPKLCEFLNIRHEKPAEVIAIGLSVGVGGWMFTLTAALIIALILRAVGVVNEPSDPPAAIGWMVSLPVWKKMLIVLSAATVEEAFFRSFLQKRIGLIASTLLFALAHFTYGNPLLLVGVTIISLVIGITFYRTKNVLPGMIAHGLFDAIQLFVLVPIAYKLMGAGA